MFLWTNIEFHHLSIKKNMSLQSINALCFRINNFSFKSHKVSHEWAFCVVVLDLPKYMNDVLYFSIQDNGLYSSIPQAIKLAMAFVTGDHIHFIIYVPIIIIIMFFINETYFMASTSAGLMSDYLISNEYLTITNGRKIFLAIGKVEYAYIYIEREYNENDTYIFLAVACIGFGLFGI